MGSPRSREIVSRLLSSGCVPYFSILSRWIHEGVLDDPHEEFMVKENRNVARSDVTSEGQMAFWTLRYTLRACQGGAGGGEGEGREGREGGVGLDLPVFLRAHSHAILTTGKYLNAVMECSQSSLSSTLEVTSLSQTPLKIAYDPQGERFGYK